MFSFSKTQSLSHTGDSNLDPCDMAVTYSLLLSILLQYWTIKNWSPPSSGSLFPENFLDSLIEIPPHGTGTHSKNLWEFWIQVYLSCKKGTIQKKLWD